MNQIIKTSLTSDKMSYKSLTFIELKIDCADIFRGVTAVISNWFKKNRMCLKYDKRII